MEETLSSTNTYTKQQWIAEQARRHPQRVFTSLHHLIDGEWMREAYRRTRKDVAAGLDGVSAEDFEVDLEGNLESLLGRIKSGSYRAPPVRRHYIPKADGSRRPLGIPTLEDKVAQRAILTLLEPIYEGDFLPCSYGFRRGRSAHDALYALRTGIMEHRHRWVIDAPLFSRFTPTKKDAIVVDLVDLHGPRIGRPPPLLLVVAVDVDLGNACLAFGSKFAPGVGNVRLIASQSPRRLAVSLGVWQKRWRASRSAIWTKT